MLTNFLTLTETKKRPTKSSVQPSVFSDSSLSSLSDSDSHSESGQNPTDKSNQQASTSVSKLLDNAANTSKKKDQTIDQVGEHELCWKPREKVLKWHYRISNRVDVNTRTGEWRFLDEDGEGHEDDDAKFGDIYFLDFS